MSVARYAKPHALVVHKARVPAEVKTLGVQWMADFGRILREIPAGHRWSLADKLSLLRPDQAQSLCDGSR